MQLNIKFRDSSIEKMYEELGGVKTDQSIGFDLISSEDKIVYSNTFTLIDLGIIVKPPEGFHVEILARSSLYKKTGLMLANSVGLIDPDYSGENDYLKISVIKTKEGSSFVVKRGMVLAQLVLRKSEYISGYTKFEPSNVSRDGFGSTDK